MEVEVDGIKQYLWYSREMKVCGTSELEINGERKERPVGMGLFSRVMLKNT